MMQISERIRRMGRAKRNPSSRNPPLTRPLEKPSRIALAATLCLAFLATPARAKDNCVTTISNVSFGNYNTINNTTGTMGILVSCTRASNSATTFTYTLKLSRGPGASYSTRSMSGTGDTLFYNLYLSPAYTSIWGDGSGGSSFYSGSLTVPANSTRSETITVYGLIPGGQNVLPGAYATATAINLTIAGVASTNNVDPFFVNASVGAQCSVTAPNMGFGAVNPLSSQTDTSMTMTVACTKNTGYTVGLSSGTTSGATIAQRLMANGADTMQYNLYTNAARSTVWGNSSGSWVAGTGAGLASNQTLFVYGRVASGQTNLAAGNYQENAITVTVTY